jgi:hypothetical protein
MAHNLKALIFLIFGTVVTWLGTGLICGGGFNSVMQDPKGGPYQTSTTTSVTVTPTTGTTATTVAVATTQYTLNNGHFASLLKQYPELFNWSDINNQRALIDQGADEAGVTVTDVNSRDAANAYTKLKAGEQAWIFAFYFPLCIIIAALGFTAYLRKSGYTLALVGLALSTVLLAWTIIIVVHYQNISFVPELLNAFADCGSNATDRALLLDANVSFGTLYGPAPRRAWLCRDDWGYDNNFRVAANLVWGGAATAFVGYLSFILAFAYLVQPFVQPQPAFKSVFVTRSADAVDFDDYSDDYSDYDY